MGLIRAPRLRPLSAYMRPDLVLPLAVVERRAIESALILCLGKKDLAAHRLGITETALLLKLAEYIDEDAKESSVLSSRAAGGV